MKPPQDDTSPTNHAVGIHRYLAKPVAHRYLYRVLRPIRNLKLPQYPNVLIPSPPSLRLHFHSTRACSRNLRGGTQSTSASGRNTRSKTAESMASPKAVS